MNHETIVAVASGPAAGGVGVVRISGPQATAIAISICGDVPAPRMAQVRWFCNAAGEKIDHGIVLYFPNPASFTGEDVVELQGHGGQVVLQQICLAAIAAGARQARPGEFTERAFLNGKLNLAQAEAVADLISAGSERAVKAALGSLQGVFSDQVVALTHDLIALRVHLEAAIDFPDEDIDPLADNALGQRFYTLQNDLNQLIQQAQNGRVLRDGLNIVLVGQPNVGKSSLMNALAGYDAAIVTDIAGTTRDVLREQMTLAGLEVRLSDTAGLRDSDDKVEQEGVRRAYQEMQQADIILFLFDDAAGITPADSELLAQVPVNTHKIMVRNKVDLSQNTVGIVAEPAGDSIRISAKSTLGIHDLVQLIRQKVGDQTQEGEYLARQRHIDALLKTQQQLNLAQQHFATGFGGELAAEECRIAQQSLGEITGEVTSDDLLGHIFSNFCIGK